MISLPTFQSMEEKRWVLAYVSTKENPYPLLALTECFMGAMLALQHQIKAYFPREILQKVYHSVIPEKHTEIRMALADTITDEILKHFSDSEIHEMIRNPYFFKERKYATVCAIYRSVLRRDTEQKARQIASQWKEELVQSLKKEGVQFPSS